MRWPLDGESLAEFPAIRLATCNQYGAPFYLHRQKPSRSLLALSSASIGHACELKAGSRTVTTHLGIHACDDTQFELGGPLEVI